MQWKKLDTKEQTCIQAQYKTEYVLIIIFNIINQFKCIVKILIIYALDFASINVFVRQFNYIIVVLYEDICALIL